MAPQSDFATRLQSYWYGGVRVPIWLRALELLFGALVRLRTWLYRRGLLRSRRPSLPMIVVGNLAVGGSGKTPFVIALVEALRERGWRPGIVSRGYGRLSKDRQRVEAGSRVSDVGDEPLLIARRTGAPTAVASRRIEAAELLAATGEVDLLIADDGLQHYALQRDLEIALIDGRRGLGNRRLLPAGPLREPVARLDSCNWVLGMLQAPDATRIDGICAGDTGEAVNLRRDEQRPLSTMREGPVHAVAGIADPRRFFDGLRAMGLQVVEHVFPDHHRFVESDLLALRDATVVTTEKDAVKLIEFSGQDWWQLPWSVELPEGFADILDLRLRMIHARGTA